MGYAICMGPCLICHRVFSFNPVRVPSFRWNGTKEPVCPSCMEELNKARERKGYSKFEIDPAAYEPCAEEELP